MIYKKRLIRNTGEVLSNFKKKRGGNACFLSWKFKKRKVLLKFPIVSYNPIQSRLLIWYLQYQFIRNASEILGNFNKLLVIFFFSLRNKLHLDKFQKIKKLDLTSQNLTNGSILRITLLYQNGITSNNEILELQVGLLI